MVTNFLPGILANLQRKLPEILPNKTPKEYLAIIWYELYCITHALRGVFSRGDRGFRRGDIKFVECVGSLTVF